MKKIFCFLFFVGCSVMSINVFAVDVNSYDPEGSVFQKIADLEEEKVLMQLKKEKAELELQIKRLAIEEEGLVREQNAAAARFAEQTEEIERQKQELANERKRLDEQKRQMKEQGAQEITNSTHEMIPMPEKQAKENVASLEELITDKYFLREIIGAGNQLIATVENLSNGKQKKVSVGKTLDGYSIKSISLDDGLELEKNGEVIILSVGTGE